MFLKMYELLSNDAGEDTLMGRSSKPKMSAGIMVLEPDSQKCLEKLINDRIMFYEQLRNHGQRLLNTKRHMIFFSAPFFYVQNAQKY